MHFKNRKKYLKNMNFPNKLKYTRDHEWLRTEGDEAVVGITAFAQNALGEIIYVDIDTEGETLTAGDRFGAVEAVKTVSDLLMPVSGTILEINPVLETSPITVNNDPYGEGWLIRIHLTDQAELDGLMSASIYEAFTKE